MRKKEIEYVVEYGHFSYRYDTLKKLFDELKSIPRAGAYKRIYSNETSKIWDPNKKVTDLIEFMIQRNISLMANTIDDEIIKEVFGAFSTP